MPLMVRSGQSSCTRRAPIRPTPMEKASTSLISPSGTSAGIPVLTPAAFTQSTYTFAMYVSQSMIFTPMVDTSLGLACGGYTYSLEYLPDGAPLLWYSPRPKFLHNHGGRLQSMVPRRILRGSVLTRCALYAPMASLMRLQRQEEPEAFSTLYTRARST